jgi:hypothetical protein
MERGAVDKHNFLPTIDGPKLSRFSDVPLQIQYLEKLSSGAHGYIFKVTIHSRYFALKIVVKPTH